MDEAEKKGQWVRAPELDYENAGVDTKALLTCPNCNEFYLHHAGVQAYHRDEDAQSVTVTTVVGGTTMLNAIPSDLSGNPSARRTGLVLQFWCESCGIGNADGNGEGCGGFAELCFAQHKGVTQVFWRYEPPPADREDADAGEAAARAQLAGAPAAGRA